MTDAPKPTTIGETTPIDEADTVLDAYGRRISQWVIERLGEDMDGNLSELFEPLVRHLSELAVKTALEVLETDGFCSFVFHEAIAEPMPDGVTCGSCRLPMADHERVPVCNYSDDLESCAVERIRHRREQHAKGAKR